MEKTFYKIKAHIAQNSIQQILKDAQTVGTKLNVHVAKIMWT